MLSNRLNAFSASQSFLVIGCASSMSVSLGRWHNASSLVFPPFRNAGLTRHGLAAPAGASGKVRLGRGTMFAKYAPCVFAVAWRRFGARPIVFYLRSG